MSLPPHRQYDFAIDLIPGASYPTGRLYNLFRPEREAMERYMAESLATGIIRPSSSPLGAGFFFVDKKDKRLHPCIDYCGLNQITLRTSTLFPSCLLLLNLSMDPPFFQNLTSEMPTTWSASEKATSGRQHSTLGHFEYLVMSFGLTNTPAVFQALVNYILRDFLNRYVFVYLNDILIFSLAA